MSKSYPVALDVGERLERLRLERLRIARKHASLKRSARFRRFMGKVLHGWPDDLALRCLMAGLGLALAALAGLFGALVWLLVERLL